MTDWSCSLDSGANAVVAYYRVHVVEVKVFTFIVEIRGRVKREG